MCELCRSDPLARRSDPLARCDPLARPPCAEALKHYQYCGHAALMGISEDVTAWQATDEVLGRFGP
jgi:hypothetical protein